MPARVSKTSPAWRNRITRHADVDPRTLTEHPSQWRLHPTSQQEALAGVIHEVGYVQPVLVSEATGHILDGHLRVGLAIREAQASVPVTYVQVSAEEERMILSTIDPLAAMAESNREQLAGLLAEVQSGEAAVQQMLAGLAEREGIVPGVGENGAGADVEPQIDRAAELREQWGVELGQCWSLGEHRVICGDCTDKAVVERLLGRDHPDAVVTDPPYGVGVDYATFHDTQDNIQALIAKFMPLLRSMEPIALTPGIPAMWHYPRPSWLLAWVHPAASGSGPWGFAGLNPILVYGDDPYLKQGLGRRQDHIVCVADRDGLEGHPVIKPLKVWKWLVERLTVEAGALCYDPFLGSGTTLIACENLGRRCFGCELDEGYTAVTLQRFLDLTNQQPVRLS